MKSAALVLLIVAVGALGLLLYSQTVVVREQQQQIQELKARLESASKTANLDLQEKCAKQAQEAFKSDGFEKEEGALFSNHYNERLNKCFPKASLQLCELGLGFLQDWNIRVGVFPEREEVLICGTGFDRVALHGVCAG
jgi:hypothetical protein